MTPAEFDKACLGLPGATMDVQWGDDHVYKVGGKMFAATGAAGTSFSFKASDIAFEALTESGRGKPAPYLARARWVWFEDMAGMDAAEVADWLKTAHALIAAKLTRKQRAEFGL
ncbi:MmcQ/YjbR family DNA-binding protein [Phenylobacterium sp.]|uniref:MmcQ/YjbR family DNA-binding protein n=1 Tax=Phenylobacterium sp. TaxID=1871053 RepID=UPI00286E9F2C|nr:MmcQ/YjbR family DNA-binding protein [Phenylobacterium sp.]